MQVYDDKTGAKIWSAAYDFTPERVVGKPMGAKAFGGLWRSCRPNHRRTGHIHT